MSQPLLEQKEVHIEWLYILILISWFNIYHPRVIEHNIEHVGTTTQGTKLSFVGIMLLISFKAKGEILRGTTDLFQIMSECTLVARWSKWVWIL